jgi:hypothetical protein
MENTKYSSLFTPYSKLTQTSEKTSLPTANNRNFRENLAPYSKQQNFRENLAPYSKQQNFRENLAPLLKGAVSKAD